MSPAWTPAGTVTEAVVPAAVAAQVAESTYSMCDSAGAVTFTLSVTVFVAPSSSVTVRLTWWSPPEANVVRRRDAVAVPSPKSHW